jgi:hypothetical protein
MTHFETWSISPTSCFEQVILNMSNLIGATLFTNQMIDLLKGHDGQQNLNKEKEIYNFSFCPFQIDVDNNNNYYYYSFVNNSKTISTWDKYIALGR